jgi:hypothetical protein
MNDALDFVVRHGELFIFIYVFADQVGIATFTVSPDFGYRNCVRNVRGALAACIALAVLVISKSSSEPASLTTEPMRTASGAVVGKVFVHREQPAVHLEER